LLAKKAGQVALETFALADAIREAGAVGVERPQRRRKVGAS